jgi:hypothetical protein
MKKTVLHTCAAPLMLVLAVGVASATTISTTPAGTGSFTYSDGVYTATCQVRVGVNQITQNVSYYQIVYPAIGSSLSYTDPTGAVHPFNVGFEIIRGAPASYNPNYTNVNCPANTSSTQTATQTYTTASDVYVVTVTLTAAGAISAAANVEPNTTQSGYINPKYVVLGVTYAPPGNQSFVQYADSTMIGTSTAFTSTTSNKIGYSVSVSDTISASGTVPDIGGKWGVSDTTTGTYAQNFTDEGDTSSSVAITSTDTWTTKVPGPASPYVGVDHDYDVIWLWLNPLLNFTATKIGTAAPTITWTGYSFDYDDIPEMDIYGVYLGWLNGHLSTPGPNTSDLVPLERTWAGASSNGQVWTAGTSPSLLNSTNTAVDATDAAAIEAADPFSKAGYTVTIPAGSETSSDGRFTLTGNQVVDYEQPPAGGQPFTQQLTESTTKTQTQGEGAKYTYDIEYSLQDKFSGSFLWDSWSTTITSSDTLTWTDQWSKTNTEQTGETATGSVTGPPCVVSGSGCNPVYTGPTEFEVFEDNVYNTFMYYPVN